MTPPCAEFAASLPLFVGGDLDVAAAEAVRVHLIGCLRCRTEAAALHRATSSLRRLAAAEVPGADDRMFAAMHAAILDQVAADEGVGAGARALAGRWGLLAAALTLLGLGFWWGQGLGQDPVWVRPPLVGTPAALDEPAKAVPWAGPRVPMRLLGDDRPLPAEAGSDGAGMLGRERLRNLVDEGLLLPPRDR